MGDLISRQAILKNIEKIRYGLQMMDDTHRADIVMDGIYLCERAVRNQPSAQPEIIRCKDCKFYSPMNRETKTGICNLIMHQNFGDNWFCAGAERRPDESDRKRSGD